MTEQSNKHFIWCDLFGHSFVSQAEWKNFGTLTVKHCVRCHHEEEILKENEYVYFIQEPEKCPNCGQEYCFGAFGCVACGYSTIN